MAYTVSLAEDLELLAGKHTAVVGVSNSETITSGRPCVANVGPSFAMVISESMESFRMCIDND